MDDATPLSLTYDSFARLWNALVSRRRARRLQIDRDAAWMQLRANGGAAPFLLAAARRKSEKKAKGAGTRKSTGTAGATKAATLPGKSSGARAKSSGARAKSSGARAKSSGRGAKSAPRKKPAVKTRARRPAARKTTRTASRKPRG